MKSFITCLALLMTLSVTSVAQQMVLNESTDTFNQAYLEKYTSHFEITEQGFAEAGAAQLLAAMRKAQFTVLGEYHQSSQLGKFTKAALGVLAEAGYNNFALEVGPHSADILAKLAKEPEQVMSNLHSLNTNFQVGQGEDLDLPIPFFDGVEDAEFLAEASRLNFDFWGLDQEYYSSPLMFSEQLLALADDQKNKNELEAAKLAFDSLFIAGYQEDMNGEDENFELFEMLLNHEIVKTYFGYFSTGDKKAQAIITALKKSWDIYDRSGRRNRFSHGHRVAYIRDNFIENYKSAQETLPKVFVKIGGFHAGRSFVNWVYDIGNLTGELAAANGTTSVNISCQPRYFMEENELSDEYENNATSPSRYFLTAGAKSFWTVVDLQPLRQQLRNFTIHISNHPDYFTIKRFAENYDFILIPPTDQYTQKNYTIK